MQLLFLFIRRVEYMKSHETSYFFWQILRTLLDCCSNSDHNVQGFALETLHVFLRHLDEPMRSTLRRIGGLANFQDSPGGDSNDSFEFGRDESPDANATPDSTSKDNDVFDPENFGSVNNPMLTRKRVSLDDRSDTASIISRWEHFAEI